MAYDANYWNSGQFQGNIPSEGPQVNESVENNPNYLNESPETNPNYMDNQVNNFNNTGQGWFDTAGIGDWYQNRMNTGNQGGNFWNSLANFFPSGQDITNAFGNAQGGSVLQGYGQHYGNQGGYGNQGQGQFDPSEELGETVVEDSDIMNRGDFLNALGSTDRPGMFGKPRGFGSGQGWFGRIGRGGGGFMGKFGTGEGWLASPETRADKRDARIERRKARREQGGGFNFAGAGQGLMDLANQQGDDYEYNLFG